MIRTARQLGDAQTHQMIATGISAGIGATAALYTALAADPEPITKALLGIAAGMVALFHNAFSGCGQTCIAATHIVDQIEPYLRQNRDLYLSQPIRTPEMQQKALALFDAAWQDVVSGCSDPALGDAGRRCISERQRGGSAPWCPTGTGCDWFTLYRDPIAQDVPNAPANPVADILGSAGLQLSPKAAALAPLVLFALIVMVLA
ncbi:MAG TPA: hypothetical protein VFA28_01950 [Bryobacteraceae bacterium]|jgi:hypothetical protein|nr:hypothetical protein [Bryobacteraceae bacterium]